LCCLGETSPVTRTHLVEVVRQAPCTVVDGRQVKRCIVESVSKDEALKQLLKTLNKQHGDDRFTPRTGTDEQFKISRELIEILVAHNWPLGDKPFDLLDDHRQQDLGLG